MHGQGPRRGRVWPVLLLFLCAPTHAVWTGSATSSESHVSFRCIVLCAPRLSGRVVQQPSEHPVAALPCPAASPVLACCYPASRHDARISSREVLHTRAGYIAHRTSRRSSLCSLSALLTVACWWAAGLGRRQSAPCVSRNLRIPLDAPYLPSPRSGGFELRNLFKLDGLWGGRSGDTRMGHADRYGEV